MRHFQTYMRLCSPPDDKHATILVEDIDSAGTAKIAIAVCFSSTSPEISLRGVDHTLTSASMVLRFERGRDGAGDRRFNLGI